MNIFVNKPDPGCVSPALCSAGESRQNVVHSLKRTTLTFMFNRSTQRPSLCKFRRNIKREMRRDGASIQLMVLFCLQHISSVQAWKSLLITTSPIHPVVSVSTEAWTDTADIYWLKSPGADMLCQYSFCYLEMDYPDHHSCQLFVLQQHSSFSQ